MGSGDKAWERELAGFSPLSLPFHFASSLGRANQLPLLCFQAAVQRARDGLPRLTRPIVAVHVRHGDACAAGRDCLPWPTYRDAVSRVASRYGAKSVLLATDDDKAPTLALAPPPQLPAPFPSASLPFSVLSVTEAPAATSVQLANRESNGAGRKEGERGQVLSSDDTAHLSVSVWGAKGILG